MGMLARLFKPDVEAHGARFVAMYERNYGSVLRYARRRVDEETARDVVAETFLVAWRSLHTLPSDPLPWLYGVARNLLAAEFRQRAREADRDRRLASVSQTALQTADHADGFHRQEALRVGFRCLSPRDREVLRLVAWEGLSVSEAARVMGCRPPTMAVRLHRARRRLLQALEEEPAAAEPAPRMAAASRLPPSPGSLEAPG
jgi:RNA polymerase sigma-70 factor (ECF subfamily)